jgi:hypothetical protein
MGSIIGGIWLFFTLLELKEWHVESK